MEPVETDAAVHAKYVSLVKFVLSRRNSVHDLAVDRGAERLRKVIQALERRSSSGMTPNKILREPIEIFGGYPGAGMRFHQLQRFRKNAARLGHRFHFAIRFDRDHAGIAWATRSATSSTVPVAEMLVTMPRSS